MAWYVNFILGFLIGSFLASYYEGYRNVFKGIFDLLAKKKKKPAADETKK